MLADGHDEVPTEAALVAGAGVGVDDWLDAGALEDELEDELLEELLADEVLEPQAATPSSATAPTASVEREKSKDFTWWAPLNRECVGRATPDIQSLRDRPACDK